MSPKADAQAIFLAGVHAVKAENLSFDLSLLPKHSPVTLLGSGKAVMEMAKKLLPQIKLKEGFLVSSYDAKIEGVDVFVSSHPLVSQKSVAAASRMQEILASLHEEDFFIYLLSGGSSALLEKPLSPLTLDQQRKLYASLLQSGASISQMNVVRKHLSAVKGGRLTQVTKAKGIIFVVSDVVGDDLQTIGSAPLYYDSSSRFEAQEILKRYGLWESVEPAVVEVLQTHETPDRPNPRIVHKIVASNAIALEAAAKKAKTLGYACEIVTTTLTGDVQDVAGEILSYVRKDKNASKKVYLFGGETTVLVRGSGKGGRNQELTLWVLQAMQDGEKFTFLSAGTDGIDGVTDAAGACVDWRDSRDVQRYLDNNDSWHYHQKEQTLIQTGATGTNVMDIMILIKE